MVKLYSKPGCGQCIATKRDLDRLKADYEYIDVSKDPDAFEYLVSKGLMQMPVVETPDDVWSGYNSEKIESLVA